MLRVGIDVTMLREQRTGVENYIHELVELLPRADQQLEIVLFSATPFAGKFPDVSLIASRASSYARWRQLELPRLLKANAIQLFHSPITAIPLAWNGPTIATIHDVNWAYSPEMYSLRRRLGHRFWCALTVRKSRRIIVPTQTTAQNLTRIHPRTVDDKISIVPMFLPRRHESRNPDFDTETLLRRLDVKPPFVLAVGTVQWRKNYLRLIEAFERLPSRGVERHQLVIVGKDGFGAETIHERARCSACAADIRLLGYLDDAETETLYRNASALAFPSLCEGFGFPLLESMVRGVPVAAANTSSLPEVGGEAAVYFDPTNVEQMADVLERVLTDATLRAELIQKGLDRVKHFTPQQMAERTAAVYRQVLNENPAPHH